MKALKISMALGLAAGLIIGAIFATATPTAAGYASAIAQCGPRPSPPAGFYRDEAVCLCAGKVCKWMWMKR